MPRLIVQFKWEVLTRIAILAAALFDCQLLVSNLMVTLTAVALIATAGEAEAQTADNSDEDNTDSDDVSFESEKYWRRGGRFAGIKAYQLTPHVARQDETCVYVAAYATAESQSVIPPDPAALPVLPRQPSSANPEPAIGVLPPPQGAAATSPDAANELTQHVAEDKKKEEKKPLIADMAKLILIAQNEGDLTFKPGLRIQPRYMHDDGNGNNDFFIRRFRLKGSGSAYGLAKYGVEMKIDNEGRYGVSPAARAENAWLDFPTCDDWAYLRAGLYDLPFSRDALTSDSKLLFMDRTLIKEQLTAVGMADNTFGLMLHGRPHCGQFEYAFGIFDNDQFERTAGFPEQPFPAGSRESDELMPAGRLVWNLWDPMTPPDGYADYMESYIGKGQRLEIGTNFAHLGDAVIHGAPDVTRDLTAWGVDLFANSGHYTFQAEYDMIIENIAGGADVISDGWYAQFGYLFNPADPCTEFAVRYENLAPIVGSQLNDLGEELNWVRVGFNFYFREHNLKVQTDYCFRSDTDLTAALPGGLGFFDEDVFEVQLQLDF
jgi:hypothetical protein